MVLTVLFFTMAVFANVEADSAAFVESTQVAIKADMAKAKKSGDTLSKKSALLKKDDSASSNKTVSKSSDKVRSAAVSAKKKLPVKKTGKEKRKSNFDFGKVLITLSQKLPSSLRMPDELLKSIIQFIKKNTFKVVLLSSFLIIIIATILFFRQKVEGKRFMTTTRLSVMDKEVQRACRYIENCFDDVGLSVDKICSEMVTGKAFLTALFERELGMSVDDFIAQVRINRAKILFKRDSSLDVDATAIKTGFSDISQFKITFEKLCGVSVDDYRKSLFTDQNV